MKRQLLTIAVFLLLGAIVNVAVAWWISAATVIGDGQSSQGAILTAAGERIAYLHWSKFGIERIKWHPNLDSGEEVSFPIGRPAWSEVACRNRYHDLPGTPEEQRTWVRVETAAGWPLLSTRYCSASHPISGPSRFEPPRCGIRLEDHKTVQSWNLARERALPLSPLWPAFAINTIFYAAILWLLFAGPVALRRAIRRRRGQCTACGYPIGVSDVCTECGKPLPKRAKAAS